jgi:iron complex outermembrane receptor protein
MLTLVLACCAAAQQLPTVTATVEVVDSRLPADSTPARRTVVLERADIAALPAHSVQELLALVAGVGVVRRGPLGVQADAQLRGATFEQVAVLVDGVRVNDPQTGHFNLDIPLPLEAVERIEVLLGPGSAVHGPGALGGVVAITTGAPSAPSASLTVGQHGLRSEGAAAPLGRGFWATVAHTSTAGFRHGTELDATQGAAGATASMGGWRLQWHASAEAKRFGAWAFYSTSYPDGREETDTTLLTFSAERALGSLTLLAHAGARQHHDLFVLDRTRPEWYTNRHRTRTGELQMVLRGGSGALAWAAGLEGERQLLASDRLGDHGRNRGALFVESAWHASSLTVSAQLRGDEGSGLDWELSPGLGFELELPHGFALSAHRGRSFRLPSFTDLYYDSPGTVGNPALRPERATSDELQLRGPAGPILLELAVFQRRASALIDFVRDDEGVHRAMNHPRVRTRGIELAGVLASVWKIERLRAGVTALSSDLEVDPQRSRYAVAHPRLEAALAGSVGLPFSVRADATWRVRRPQRGGAYGLLDLRGVRPLGRGLEVELEISNALDHHYQELPGVDMPGRWASLSIRFSLPR